MKRIRLNSYLLSVLIVLIFPFETAISCQVGETKTISHFTSLIGEFVKQYEGCFVEFADPDNIRFWYGIDGKVALAQKFHQGKGTIVWQISYWNSNYNVVINMAKLPDGNPMSSFACTAIDKDFPGVFCHGCMMLLGKDVRNLRSFYDMVVDPNASNSVELVEINNNKYQTLTSGLPRHADYEFSFDGDALVYVSFTLERGDLVADHRLGEYVNWEPAEGVQSWKFIHGPLEYGENGKPIAIGKIVVETKYDKKPVESHAYPGNRIAKAEFDPDCLSADRIDVEKFGIPSLLPVRVESPVPYELRDGRLVKVADGRAEKIIKKSRFRGPSFWQRWRYPALVGCFVLAIGIYVWIRR